MMCEGSNYDELTEKLLEDVESTGFTRMLVEQGDGEPELAYTIGLALEDHPELVMVDIRHERSAPVLDRLARRVLAGEHLEPGIPILDEGEVLEVVEVNPWHLRRGLLAAWGLWGAWISPPPVLEALQVLAPPGWFCDHHGANHTRLDRPGRGSPGGPNREARRRRRRQRG